MAGRPGPRRCGRVRARRHKSRLVAEFEDSALLKVFGQAGRGVFPAQTVVQQQICDQYGVRPIGELDSVRERFYAISTERKIKHPAVARIVESAIDTLFH